MKDNTTCPKCGHSFKDDDNLYEGIGWTITWVVLFVFVLFTFMSWVSEHTSEFDTFTGSYVQYLVYIFDEIADILKDII